MTPDGLVSSLFGPALGPEGNWKLWNDSRREFKLRSLFSGVPDLEIFYLHGDPAYSLAYGIMGPYQARRLTPEQIATNVEMSSLRIVVEWGFGNVLNQFSYGEQKRNQKTGKVSPLSPSP